jgi:tetratricopeptide (TPR) repeat protein
MKRALPLFPLLLAGLAGQTTQPATQPATRPEITSFMLRNRQALHGRLLGLDGHQATIELAILDGTAVVRRKLEEFTPETQFRILATANPPKTFADHLQLAQKALALGILPQAAEHAGRARALADQDGTGQQRKQLDAWSANTLETLFRRSLEAGDVDEARRYLRLLATRVPEERTEAQMNAMFDALAKADLERRTVARSQAAAREASAQRAEQDRLWAPIEKRVAEADVLVNEGLRNSRRTVQATRSFERAIALYRAAWRDAQGLLEQSRDPQLHEDAARLGQRIRDSAVQAALHAGNALTVQGDYRSALEWANQALAMDPGNGDAKQLIHTIQIAQAAGSRWGWGW